MSLYNVYDHDAMQTHAHKINVSTGNVPNNFAQLSYICVVKAKFLRLIIFAQKKSRNIFSMIFFVDVVVGLGGWCYRRHTMQI